MTLHNNNQSIEVVGLVDSGATISVLPYEIGIQLSGVWDERKAILRLAGNLSNQPAMPFFAIAEIGQFTPVRLAFAWVKSMNVPLILGQTNFFLEFDVCFYRSKLEFEVKPKEE
ncbi:hypothetical protein [Tolypothrix sp. FACHB-123]|uniref:hypothetical protein n=1 Tax=Tolypothrix sp. FACHB-123 TaxID=2692868 RepID=UPI0035BC805C